MQETLAPLTNWRDTIRLVPNSGVQFVDFAFDIDELRRSRRTFIERREGGHGDAEQLKLLRVPDSDEHEDPPSHFQPRESDDVYDIDTVQALEVFLEKWVPIPVLRVKGVQGGHGFEELDEGPTNWARARVVALPDRMRGSGVSHRVTFAFDTELAEKLPNRPYVSLSPDDAQHEMEFRFAHHMDDIGWFLADPRRPEEREATPWFQEWVDTWARDLFHDFVRQRPARFMEPGAGRSFRPDMLLHRMEHWARYIALLETLAAAVKPPKFKLVDTVSPEPKVRPVSVDLILDIGNSRTCGILIESYPNEKSVDLNNSMVLQLRDLERPENVYSEPFDSHVELAQANFGRYDLSRLSTRPKAFFWPSLVRVGTEASRIRSLAEDTGALTGMSSPKRYLWDCDPVTQEWRFQPRDYAPNGEGPPIERAARRFVNSRGDVIDQLKAEQRRPQNALVSPASRLTFSRSSFFTFMVAEVISQALSMINAPGVRARRQHPDSPRVLERIILTLPPATTIQEQQILQSRVDGAIRLIWRLMDWEGGSPQDPSDRRRLKPRRPTVRVSWDEASCNQFVWLYGEITRKFVGGAAEFARLVGRDRPFAEPGRVPAADAPVQPSIRVASVDVGGGTTDLMITTYYVEDNRALKPSQNFREGFRIAGDDVVRAIIEELVLPAIQTALEEAGINAARELLSECFGGDRHDIPEQEKHLRRQFALQILRPIALAILERYEGSIPHTEDVVEAVPVADLLGSDARARLEAGERAASERLLAYLEERAARRGAPDFRLEDVRIPVDFAKVRRQVDLVLGQIADNLAEAINAFDVDVVLLSGRPSGLPAVLDLFVSRLPVRPDRIVSLGEYRAGIWYPFRRADNVRVADPKTCTVVGGMLCALAERQIQNFTLYTNRLTMRSTARFIGALEDSGQMFDSHVIFRDVDLDDRKAAMPPEAKIRYFAPMRIGFRQLPWERWTTTPLYRLEMSTTAQFSPDWLPFTIKVVRADLDDEDETDPERRVAYEAGREQFAIEDVVDATGMPRKPEDFRLSLCTLNASDGYWLDTGILSVT